MKKERIITLAASLMLLTACSEYTGEDTPDGRIPVNLGYTTLTAEEATRTAAATNINDANIATGDKITVQIKNNGAAENTYTSYTYTAAAAGAMTPPSTKPYYPAGSTNIDILAYYPYNAAANFDVAADQTTDDNYKASDLMVATKTNQAKTTGTVALAFQHKMAKLVVTATAGDGVSKINTITLKQVKRRVSFTNTSGAVGTATSISGTDVILFKSGNSTTGTGAALIPGQTITGNLIEIATDQGTATYSVPGGKTFTANTKYTISITVNRTAVGTTNSITWGNEASLTINPTQVIEVVPVSRATTDDVGKVICSNGHIHDNVSDINCGGTASAMIVYVGNAGTADASSATYKGLAVALTDASTSAAWYGTGSSYSSTCVYQNSTFSNHYGYADMKGIQNTNQMADKTGNCASHTTHAAAAAAKNYSSTVAVPANCSQWFLPSSGQWFRMFRNATLNLTWSNWGYSSGSGSDYNKVNKMFTDAGANSAVFSSGALYWSSSGYDTNRAVRVRFDSSVGVSVDSNNKSYTYRVRAFLAF